MVYKYMNDFSNYTQIRSKVYVVPVMIMNNYALEYNSKYVSLSDLAEWYTYIDKEPIDIKSLVQGKTITVRHKGGKPVWACRIPVDEFKLQTEHYGEQRGKCGDFVVYDDCDGKPVKGSQRIVNTYVFHRQYNNTSIKKIGKVMEHYAKYIRTNQITKNLQGVGEVGTLVAWEETPQVDVMTYRIWFKVLKKRIEEYFAGCGNRKNIIALTGVRGAGKTTLFKQLCNCISDAVYLDCSKYCGLNFTECVNSLKQKGKRVFLLDSVCKLSEQGIISLKEAVSTNKDIMCLLTGDIPHVIRGIVEGVGNSETIEIPPIMYIEHLHWGNKKSSTKELYDYIIAYPESNYLNLVKNVITDALNSYKEEQYKELLERINSCFGVGTYGDNNYCQLFEDIIKHQYKYRQGEDVRFSVDVRKAKKEIARTKLECIATLYKILSHAGFIKPISGNVGFVPDVYLFEYPLYFYRIGRDGGDSKKLRVEELILSRLNYYYGVVRQYKSSNGRFCCEYNHKGVCGSLELRFNNNVYTPREVGVRPHVVVSDVMSSNKLGVLRTDLLVCVLENAYIRHVMYHYNDDILPINILYENNIESWEM